MYRVWFYDISRYQLAFNSGRAWFIFIWYRLYGWWFKSYAGDKLKDIIDKYTSSPVKGILIGALVTCLIQSSSGTTALTIGLIRSGLMNLNQAVGIIMGANIGTVITSVLVGLKISKYAVYFIIIGAFVSMFSKNKSQNTYHKLFLDLVVYSMD